MRALAALVLLLAAVPLAHAASPLLQPCTIGETAALCGTVTVPENRLVVNSRTIGLHVAVLPAREKPVRADPVFYIAGGPGGVASEMLPGIAQLWSPVNEHRDIVFVDQRGVGGSNPLRCAQPAPDYAGTVEQFVDACVASTNADVTHYRTPDAIDDLESVRVALGYGKVDIYGASYGGTVVQMYLAQHPAYVRTAIMDSTSWFDVPVFERWGSSAQRALDLIRDRCRRDAACNKAFPRWYPRFKPMLAKLAHGGATDVTVGKQTVRIDAAATADTIEDMTTTAVGASQVPFVLARAEAGRYGPLARQVAYRQAAAADARLQVMFFAITCTEPWAALDVKKVWADAAPTYMRYSDYTRSWVEQSKACAYWPTVAPDPEESVRVSSTLPVLNLLGEADPKDPAANTLGFAKQMPNGKQIVVPEQGHGAAYAGCMPRVVANFFEAGTAKGLDTSCVSLIEAPAFRLK